MIHRVEIAEDACGAEHTPQYKGSPGLFWNIQGNGLGPAVIFQDNNSGKQGCHQIAEETFLYGRKIAGQADTDIHACKAECRHKNHGNAPEVIVLWLAVHLFSPCFQLSVLR